MPEPEWQAPFPYGFPAALDAAGSGAVPLLAGFTFTLIGFVVSASDKVRYPGISLSFLIASAVFLVAAVQAAFWTKQFAITPSEVKEWGPNDPPGEQLALQRLHRRGYTIWRDRFAFFYRWGIVLLLVGVGMALVPRTAIGPGRGLALALAGLGLATELVWILATRLLEPFPVANYLGQPDEPRVKPGGRPPLWYRRWPRLLRYLRKIVPLPQTQGRERPSTSGNRR